MIINSPVSVVSVLCCVDLFVSEERSPGGAVGPEEAAPAAAPPPSPERKVEGIGRQMQRLQIVSSHNQTELDELADGIAVQWPKVAPTSNVVTLEVIASSLCNVQSPYL